MQILPDIYMATKNFIMAFHSPSVFELAAASDVFESPASAPLLATSVLFSISSADEKDYNSVNRGRGFKD